MSHIFLIVISLLGVVTISFLDILKIKIVHSRKEISLARTYVAGALLEKSSVARFPHFVLYIAYLTTQRTRGPISRCSEIEKRVWKITHSIEGNTMF